MISWCNTEKYVHMRPLKAFLLGFFQKNPDITETGTAKNSETKILTKSLEKVGHAQTGQKI